jgi:hypothetical protein
VMLVRERFRGQGRVAAAALLSAAATAGIALAGGGHGDDDRGRGHSYHVGLWGDVPYSEAQRTAGVPSLVADMNRSRLAFSIHDGDIKAGGEPCDDAIYHQFEGYLNALRAPAMFTPGDNEWTDCDRPAAGGFDSAERLEFIRTNLFDSGRSFGQHRIRLEVQDEPYVENRRWHFGDVTYATLHVVGSDNNRSGDVDPDPVEWAARDAATNEWLRETFAEAREHRSDGVMLVIQANPGFDAADATRAPQRDPLTLGPDDGFAGFMRALREETIAFGGPVVLVHGDSHYFRIDKPLLDSAGNRIENFTRVETPGDNAQSESNDVQWVRATVDPRDPEVFSFEHEVVEANLVPYQP